MTTQHSRPVKILFASDGSDHALAAACLLNDLPLPPASAITVLGVLVPRDASNYVILEKMLQKSRDSLKNDAVEVQVELKTGYPAEQVMECAEEHQVDLIVLGAKGLRHTLGILLGGVAQQVVEYSQKPVLVVRAPYQGLKQILVVTDGSSHSQNSLDFLTGSGSHIQFPLPSGVDLRVAHVTPPPSVYYQYLTATYLGPEMIIPIDDLSAQQAEEEEQGKQILAQAVDTLQQAGIEATSVLLKGDAATEIINYANENHTDLILAGSRGLSLTKSWLLGSVSRKLVHYASCSVMVTK